MSGGVRKLVLLGGRVSDHHDLKLRSTWPKWLMLAAFVFIAFQSVIFALAFKGSAFVLLAPGVVCAVKAVDIWRDLRKIITGEASSA